MARVFRQAEGKRLGLPGRAALARPGADALRYATREHEIVLPGVQCLAGRGDCAK